MELYVMQGADRKDCELKIIEKFKQPFTIRSVREIRMGGFLGLGGRKGVEVQFNFLPKPLPNFEDEKRKLIAITGKDPDQLDRDKGQKEIINAINELKDKIESNGAKREDHPSLVRAAELLRHNDFSETYINGMLERARKELPLEILDDFDTVQNRLVEWIGESVSIYREASFPWEAGFPWETESPRGRARILALVGPTGVGKTTTIAKLAAKFRIHHSPPLSVRMITIDAFRIGAREQLERYGELMGLPVSYIDNRRDLKKEISLYQEETDIILIDTIGKSPRDSAKLGEMKEFLDAAPSRTEIHLALSASTKTSDIAVILRQFEPFNYRAVLLTKLDETSHIGNVISVLAEEGKSVSWITDGQKVPSDIKKADAIRFLTSLDEFKVDRDLIEKRFPAGEADQSQWS